MVRRENSGGALNILLSLIDKLNLAFGLLAGGFIIIVIFSTFYEVVSRKLGYPTAWTLEISVYLLIGAAYLSLGYTERVHGHINVDFFVAFLPRKGQALVDLLVTVLKVAFALYLAWWGWQIVGRDYAADVRSFSQLRFPKYLTEVPIPVGLLLLALQYLLRLRDNLSTLLGREIHET